MARFRVEVEKLGYAIGELGKHGNFEAAGIAREAVMAFSTRRQEVLEARRGSGLEAGVIATLATRSAKEQGVDRDALLTQWQERAWSLGLDLVGMVRDARQRSSLMAIADRRASQDRPSIAQRGKVMVLELAERLGIREGDSLVPARIHLRPAQEIAAAHAVASAVRHLSEREAAFKTADLAKAALDLALPTTMPLIEKRIGQLIDKGALSKGRGAMQGWLTTTDAVALESRVLAEIEKGKGAVAPIIAMDEAGPQLQASASLNFGMQLNAGQEAAGRMTSDKGIAVMDSRTRKLLSVRNFLVTITRLRDELTLIVDNRDKVEVGIDRNPGDKTSALEVTERLGTAAAKGQAAGKRQDVARSQDVENKRELERTITKVVPFEMGI